MACGGRAVAESAVGGWTGQLGAAFLGVFWVTKVFCGVNFCDLFFCHSGSG